MKRIISLFLILIVLASCGVKSNVALVIDDKIITVDSYYEELIYFSKILKKDDIDDKFNDRVLDAVILDNIVDLDLKKKSLSPSKKDIDNYEEILIEKLGSRDDLIRTIKSYGISKDEFQEAINKSCKLHKHFDVFKDNLKFNEDELRKFYKNNREDLYEYRLADIRVSSSREAEGLIKELGEDNKNLDNIISRYNDDIVKSNNGYISDYIDRYDSSFIDDRIMTLEIGDKLICKNNGEYHLLILLDKLKDFNSLYDKIKEKYINEKYLSYINDLSKKYEVKIYKRNIKKGLKSL